MLGTDTTSSRRRKYEVTVADERVLLHVEVARAFSHSLYGSFCLPEDPVPPITYANTVCTARRKMTERPTPGIVTSKYSVGHHVADRAVTPPTVPAIP